MKIPAIRAKIGTWDYYVTTLTFKQVSQFVSKIDDQLHKSEGLKDLIQRSITDNYVSIKDYIIKQPERFFNSLVLAVYDDYPTWIEIDFKYNNKEEFSMGLLDFPGSHMVFPVDGQHRVEGIKAALKENPSLRDEKIAVIFIGHKNSEEGKKQTRRLFTTLNRYAKPVSIDDIIALDEDDIAAIITRELLEEYDLFTDSRVVYAKQKAIPTSNKDAITSIITLYQANVELFKSFYKNEINITLTKSKLEEILKFRPTEDIFNAFRKYCLLFWNSFKQVAVIKDYLKSNELAALKFRNEDGGNLIFRPVGFLPLIKAVIKVYSINNISYSEIFKRVNTINLEMDTKPWRFVLWNPLSMKMIMSSAVLTELMLIYLIEESVLSKPEIEKLKESYASHISIEDPKKVKGVLKGLK